MKQMSPKERWLASIKMHPVDRLVYWPKLDLAYPTHQRKPFEDQSIEALHQWMGTDMRYGIGPVFQEVTQHSSQEILFEGNTRRTIYTTPHGVTEQVALFDSASVSWHPVKFPIHDRESLHIMTEYYADMTVELDRARLDETRCEYEAVGEKGIVVSVIGESPLMYFVEFIAGVEDAHYLLADYRADVEALFQEIHRVLLRKTEIMVENSPADLFTLLEDTSTTLISPAQYQRYCFPQIKEYASISRAAGRNMELHMCGKLKGLLPMLSQLPVEMFEAFTSPPVGNTTLLDGRSACPHICLCGGTNATLWLQPLNEILQEIETRLDELPHHQGIILTSGGVQPPACPPETIKAVADWLLRYPLRFTD